MAETPKDTTVTKWDAYLRSLAPTAWEAWQSAKERFAAAERVLREAEAAYSEAYRAKEAAHDELLEQAKRSQSGARR